MNTLHTIGYKNTVRPVCASDVARLGSIAWMYGRDADEAAAPFSYTLEREADDTARQILAYHIADLEIAKATDEFVPISFLEVTPRESKVLDQARRFAD